MASAHVEFHEVVNYDLYVTVSVKDGVISKVALNDEKMQTLRRSMYRISIMR